MTADWQRLAREVDRIGRKLPRSCQDAYYQLVGYATKATANLYALRRAEFTDIRYAARGRAATNDLADETDRLFAVDRSMSDYYNNELAGGKWKHFQTQPKIGYGDVERYGPSAPWQQPELNNEALPDEVFPAVRGRPPGRARAEGVGGRPDPGGAEGGHRHRWARAELPRATAQHAGRPLSGRIWKFLGGPCQAGLSR